MAHPKLIEDPDGMVFEYLDEKEAEFLYEEVFIRRSYLQHGVGVDDGAVVIDAGANVGLFSLQCLREANRVQVYAFEPIPIIYGVLVRNLHNSVECVETGTCPRPMAVRVALGTEHGKEKFTFYGCSPGESTRHPEEREKQQRVLLADEDAACWRRALQPSGAPHQTPQNSVEAQRVEKAARTLTIEGKHQDNNSIAAVVTSRAHDRPRLLPRTEPSGSFVDAAPSCGVGAAPKSLVMPTAYHAVSETAPKKERSEVLDPARQELGPDEVAADWDCKLNAEDGQEVQQRGESFVCIVVPLSLALSQLGIRAVDLLKVDVEGDELAVLWGIDDDDWPKIKQIALEVHDVDGRLAAVVALLRSEPAAFDEVCWEPQRTSEVRGYIMVVPEALDMFLVFAKRRTKLANAALAVQTVPGGGRSNSDDARDVGEAEVVGLSGVAREGDGSRDDVGMLPRFCSCATVASVPR